MDTYTWERGDKDIICKKENVILFTDSIDHWDNGVRRLLNLSEEDAQKWVEASLTAGANLFGKEVEPGKLEQQIQAITSGWQQQYEISAVQPNQDVLENARTGKCGHDADTIFANSIATDTEYSVVGCSACQYGWLVDAKDPSKVLSDVVTYEEEYFQGGVEKLGYGDYMKQEEWRLEKAYRLVRQMKATALWLHRSLEENTRVLDVGSGYGFLRKAVADEGWIHDGIEASQFATDVCKDQYGYDTFVGDLHDFSKQHPGEGYDIIVLADVLEHVVDPIAELKGIKELLKPKGLCLVRTPSITSIEQSIFGNYFYSLKREHFNYFSPRSVSLFSELAGLSPRFVITQSHFLQGFIGEGIRVHETGLRGSDIYAIIQKQ